MQVEKDKIFKDLLLPDDKIAKMSKNKFKKLVKAYVTNAALKYLNTLAVDHSKSKNLVKEEMKCSKYLNDERFSVSEVRLLFELRTRMFPVKTNFRHKYSADLNCEYCKIQLCDQKHQLSCSVMKKFVPELTYTSVKYNDLFGSADKQLIFIKLYSKVARQREVLLESLQLHK